MFGKFKRWLQGETSHQLTFHSQLVKIRGRQYLLRQVNSGDVPAMVEIERQNFGTPPWSANAFELEISRERDRLYLVMTYDSQVIGYVGCSFNWYHRESHITNIAVLPAYQSQGVGEQLIRALLRVSRQTGMTTISLEVRASNARAQHLYQRLGFRQLQLKHRYYLDDHEDAWEMNAKIQSKEEEK